MSKQQYYCDIPWAQIWGEYNAWVGYVSWAKQQRKIMRICRQTIPWELPWAEIWSKFHDWSVMFPYQKRVSWRREEAMIQYFIQVAADKAVNEE